MKIKTLLIVLVSSLGASLFAARNSVTVSVRAQADTGYQRVRLADGSFKPETYVLANGGAFPGTVRDGDIEKVSYPELAGVIAHNLARQNYFLASKSEHADLLLVIHWGTTLPYQDAQNSFVIDQAARAMASYRALKGPPVSLASRMNGMAPEAASDEQDSAGAAANALESAIMLVDMENRHRDMMNQRNANLLGYMDAINARREMVPWGDVGGLQHDLMSEIEEARYYIVIGAYDFQAARKQGKKVLKWVARISIAQNGNDFSEKFAAMLASARPYLGQNADGLLRKYRPDARVDLGELKFLGEANRLPERTGSGELKN